MSAASLLAELGELGVVVWAEAGRLRYRPRSAVDTELRERLVTHKAELLERLGRGGDHARTDPAPPILNSEPAGNLLERFLGDSTLPAAVFHSRALDMDFILARDEAALAALTEADQALPVIYFAECSELAKLPLRGLRAVLDLRQVFGPSAKLVGVQLQKALR